MKAFNKSALKDHLLLEALKSTLFLISQKFWWKNLRIQFDHYFSLRLKNYFFDENDEQI